METANTELRKEAKGLNNEPAFEITSRQKSKATQRGGLIILPGRCDFWFNQNYLLRICYGLGGANFAPPESLAGKHAAMRCATRVRLRIMNRLLVEPFCGCVRFIVKASSVRRDQDTVCPTTL